MVPARDHLSNSRADARTNVFPGPDNSRLAERRSLCRAALLGSISSGQLHNGPRTAARRLEVPREIDNGLRGDETRRSTRLRSVHAEAPCKSASALTSR